MTHFHTIHDRALARRPHWRRGKDPITGAWRNPDPTRCADCRARLDTYLRRATAKFKNAMRTMMVEQDGLGLGMIHITDPGERLERFNVFSRQALKSTFNVDQQIASVINTVYARGYETAFKERKQKLVHHFKPSSLYPQQVSGEIRMIMESSLQTMSRSVAIGVSAGESSKKLFSRVSSVLKSPTRGRLMSVSHTLVSQTYNHAKLDAYQILGVTRIGVIAEGPHFRPSKKKTKDQVSTTDARRAQGELVSVLTAGDDRVCEVCQDLEGEVFTISESRSVLPAHERCRCVFVPEEDFDELLALLQEENK